MNDIDVNKYLKKINKNNKPKDSKIKKYLKSLGIRVLIVIVLFLSLSIACKSSNKFKEKVHDYIYTEDISFTKIKKFYNKYLGGILPLKKDADTLEVFNEKLVYDSASKYIDGVKLSVNSNYLVPAINEGMITFIGEKKDYGSTVIIEDLDGLEIWYGNVNTTNLKLYDYVEKGSLLGEANEILYLVYSKDGKFLNYEEYLS